MYPTLLVDFMTGMGLTMLCSLPYYGKLKTTIRLILKKPFWQVWEESTKNSRRMLSVLWMGALQMET